MLFMCYFLLCSVDGMETKYLVPIPNVLLDINNAMRTVKLSSNKILQFLKGMGVQLSRADPYNGHKMVVGCGLYYCVVFHPLCCVYLYAGCKHFPIPICTWLVVFLPYSWHLCLACRPTSTLTSQSSVIRGGL